LINWHKVIMNLKGAGGLNLRQIAAKSGISHYKVQRISQGHKYRLDLLETLRLLDLHYDYCFHLHDKQLLI
jgi:hypothetical protein